ncbi:MAG: insulinase family protein, partial [Acidobacteriota bacterium]
MKDTKFKIQNSKFFRIFLFLSVSLTSFVFAANAQETPPAPSAPRSVKIPSVQEKTLPNGLKVVVVERKNLPLVTASLLFKSGANVEDDALAGVADLTASMLLRGTKTRTATQIAQDIEFLGGNINSGAGWNSSNVT